MDGGDDMKKMMTLWTGAALAACALALASAALASAKGTAADAYKAALTAAGNTVTEGATPAKHTSLHADGTLITAAKGGQSATVELIVYASRDELLADWNAVNGSGPKPKVATKDFDGKVLYWNETAVLAVSFASPNEPGLAQAAADIFLGRRGTGGPAAGGATGGAKLPNTGDGVSVAGAIDFGVMPAALAAAGALVVAAAGATSWRSSRRRAR
jgi:hypothetical protein